MPHMHSESALVHAQAALLFAQPGMEDTLRFVSYPHPLFQTCPILGRQTTPEGLTFLSEPESGF